MARQALKYLLTLMIGYKKMQLHSHLKMAAEHMPELTPLAIVHWCSSNSACILP